MMARKVFWIGDSTVQTNTAETWPQRGMGQELCSYLRPEAEVINLAKNGRSTKSFLEERRFTPVIEGIEKNDLLLITFGHNDEKCEDPNRYTPADGAFTENLRYFAEAALRAQALPVLITPLCRRRFEGDTLQKTHGEYPEAMRRLASAENLPLIDLTAQSYAYVQSLGDEASKRLYMNFVPGLYENYPDGSEDNTHLRHEGAVRFCGMVARGLAALGGDYAAPLLPEWLETLP